MAKSLRGDRPLVGVRVLSMEQAAALPFATRHLADLGAEVIRLESHQRRGGGGEADLFRNKRRLGLDLASPGGPEAFLAIAAGCDVVAHNFTPRVMRKFGLDYLGVRAVNERVIYVSLTGFGTTGPWGERPLFGPGAEAVSGHNWMIGEPDAWPGRPGTIVYADNTCGLNTAFAILAALEERGRTGRGQHIDISLYETAVSQLGPVVAERAYGAPTQARTGNHDANYALQGAFAAQGHDRNVALSATESQLPAVARALGLHEASEARVAEAIAASVAEAAVEALQREGVPAAVVADASDHLSDPHLWARAYFGVLSADGAAHPHAGPSFGGGATVEMAPPHALGEDTRDILRDVAGMSDDRIEELFASGAAGEHPKMARPPRPPAEAYRSRIERGELSRVDDTFGGWRAAREVVR
ncbi:MAG: hypothetical protein GEU80_06025 [Dehalococcoidia bacterium]|nr:hypothetical protein [Dehalococcoidia bacterium]